MSVVDEFRKANDAYASTFQKGHLPMPPARHVAVLTAWMHACFPPASWASKKETPMSFVMQVAGQVKTPYARWLFPNNYSAPILS